VQAPAETGSVRVSEKMAAEMVPCYLCVAVAHMDVCPGELAEVRIDLEIAVVKDGLVQLALCPIAAAQDGDHPVPGHDSYRCLV
jgi:hypothetical protein